MKLNLESNVPTHEEAAELANLFHLARTALAGTWHDKPSENMRHARKIWAADQFADKYGCSPLRAYKKLDRALAHFTEG